MHTHTHVFLQARVGLGVQEHRGRIPRGVHRLLLVLTNSIKYYYGQYCYGIIIFMVITIIIVTICYVVHFYSFYKKAFTFFRILAAKPVGLYEQIRSFWLEHTTSAFQGTRLSTSWQELTEYHTTSGVTWSTHRFRLASRWNRRLFSMTRVTLTLSNFSTLLGFKF